MNRREFLKAVGAAEVDFDVSVPAGPAELQTWLTIPEGETHGAYFVTVERIEQ